MHSFSILETAGIRGSPSTEQKGKGNGQRGKETGKNKDPSATAAAAPAISILRKSRPQKWYLVVWP